MREAKKGRTRRGLLGWLGGLAFLALLLADPAGALGAARASMALWAESVAPALFPFLAVLPLLTSREAQGVYNRLLGRPLGLLFRLPGRAASAVTAGLLAGSPAGALACVRTAEGMPLGEFKRMALLCMGAGPVYLVSGVGVALLDSRRAGFLLAAAQLASQLLLGVALRRVFAGETRPIRPPGHPGGADGPVGTAALSLLRVAGYMVLFAVLSHFAANFLGPEAGALCQMLLDLPGGVARAAALPLSPALRLPLLGGLVGFAGVCVAAQNMAVLGPLGLRWGEYLGVKCAHGLLCALFCAAGQGLLQGDALPIPASPSPLRLASLAMVGVLLPALSGFLPRREGDP